MRGNDLRTRALCVALVLGTNLAGAQPKTGKASKPTSPTPADTAQPAEARPEPETSPYLAGEDTESDAEDPATTKPQAEDARLDEPPPRTGPKPDGIKLSPLNPEANEFPSKSTTSAPHELTALLSDIATLRSRVAALTTSLFRSKLAIYAQTEGDDSAIASFVLTLDGGIVFRGPARFSGDGKRPLYEHAIAPGSHVVGVEIERYDVRGQTYKTWQTSKFTLVVPENRRLKADILLEDDSDMADDFPDDQDGSYALSVELRARVVD